MWIRVRYPFLIAVLTLSQLLMGCSPGSPPTPALLTSPTVAATEEATPVLQPSPAAASLTPPTVAVGGEHRTVPPSDQVTIIFACDEIRQWEFTQLARAFQDVHPEIRIEIKLFDELFDPDERMYTHDRLRKTAEGADTFLWYNPQPARDTQHGYILDLKPLLENDRGFATDDIFPSLLQHLQWRGGLWGLPAQANPILIFYNKDLFDAAGVEYPQPGWMWDALLDKALASTRHLGEETVQYGFADYGGYGFGPYLEAQAGSLVNEIAEPPLARLDAPEVVRAVQSYTDLFLRHKVMPNPFPSAYPPTRSDIIASYRTRDALIQSGKVAMWTDTWASLTNYVGPESGVSFEVGVAPFPTGKVETNPVYLWAYIISVGTDHPQESWQWITYLSENFEGRFQVPPRRSLLEASGLQDQVGDEAYRILLQALEGATPPNERVIGADRLVWEVLSREVLAGDKEVEEELAELQVWAMRDLTALEQAQPEATPIHVATPEQPDERVSLTFAVRKNAALYQKLAEAFNASQQEIRVEIKTIQTEYFDLPRMATSSDAFLWYGDKVLSAEDKQHVLNLQPLIEADSGFSVDDFYPRQLEAFRQEGDLWGLPGAAELEVVYYNKQLFDQEGVAYPQLDWSWDDLLATATRLTEGEGEEKRYGFVPQPGSQAFQVNYFFQGRGGFLVDAPQQPTAPTLDNPLAVEALRWYANLVTEHEVMLSLSGQEWSRFQNLIAEGRSAMWTGFTSEMKEFSEEELGFAVGMVPMPRGEKGGTTFYFSGYAISAHSPCPQEAWRWLVYLTEQQAQPVGAPSRRSVAESATYREQVGREAAAALQTSLVYEDIAPKALREAAPWYSWAYRWYRRAVDKVMRGESEQKKR